MNKWINNKILEVNHWPVTKLQIWADRPICRSQDILLRRIFLQFQLQKIEGTGWRMLPASCMSLCSHPRTWVLQEWWWHDYAPIWGWQVLDASPSMGLSFCIERIWVGKCEDSIVWKLLLFILTICLRVSNYWQADLSHWFYIIHAIHTTYHCTTHHKVLLFWKSILFELWLHTYNMLNTAAKPSALKPLPVFDLIPAFPPIWSHSSPHRKSEFGTAISVLLVVSLRCSFFSLSLLAMMTSVNLLLYKFRNIKMK